LTEYDENGIVHDYTTSYIRGVLKPDSGIYAELQKCAEENDIPIVEPETAAFLRVFTKALRPRKVLEIGCAIGYSAIIISEGLADGGHITTVDYLPGMVEIANENFKRAGAADRITAVAADAKELLPSLDGDGSYDMIFLDGPKSHYIHMLDDCVRLLRIGGALVADNTLYKGMTPDPAHVVRRKITIVKRLRRFIEEINARPDLDTCVLSVGDGVTVSIKKESLPQT
jgi:predicted O-methyltransferase YrrM